MIGKLFKGIENWQFCIFEIFLYIVSGYLEQIFGNITVLQPAELFTPTLMRYRLRN